MNERPPKLTLRRQLARTSSLECSYWADTASCPRELRQKGTASLISSAKGGDKATQVFLDLLFSLRVASEGVKFKVLMAPI